MGVGVPFFWGSSIPIEHKVGLPPYQVTAYSIQPFGHNVHWPKIGGCAPLGEVGWVPIEHKVAWAEAYLHTK